MMWDSNDVTSRCLSSDLPGTIPNQFSFRFMSNTVVCSWTTLTKAGCFLLMTYKSPKKNEKSFKIFSVL